MNIPVRWDDSSAIAAEPVAESPSGAQDPGSLVRPMLEALSKVTGLECTYLTVFDWDSHTQQVCFAFNAASTTIEEGIRIQLPPGVSPEAFPGVTRSPAAAGIPEPDSWIAKGLGLTTYLSVPVTLSRHRLYGMLCGASAAPHDLGEPIVTIFEAFADTIAQHLVRSTVASIEARATQAEQQLSARARFLAEAEHRLKTPLAVLQGSAMLLRDRREELSEIKLNQLTDALISSVRWLSSEVEAMLQEARSELYARQLVCKPVALGPLVRDLAVAFDGLDSGHRVVAQVDDDTLASVDEIAMRQILGHLIDNAVQHGPAGGRIKIRVTRGIRTIAVDVIDDGTGPPADMDVFDPFSRDPSSAERRTGIRLGLHIVRKLAEAMAGSVAVLREPDGRTTFSVTVNSAAVVRVSPPTV